METQIALVTEPSNLERVRKSMSMSRVLGLDSETLSLSPYNGRMRTLQISTVNETYVIDADKVGYDNMSNALNDIILDPKIIKVAHNWKFDLGFMNRYMNLSLNVPSVFDTLTASQLINGGALESNNARVSHALGNVVPRFLNAELDKTLQKSNWDKNLFREQLIYAGLDSAILQPLYRVQAVNLRNNQLEQVAALEFACIEASCHIELSGIYLDRDRWLIASEKFGAENKILADKLHKILGYINLDSNKQCLEAFNERLGLKISSVAKAYLLEVAENYTAKPNLFGDMPLHSIPDVIADFNTYRSNAKKLSSYGEAYFENINSTTGRIHSSFNQNYTDTGRYSSTSPALQTIPHIDMFRHSFMAPEGRKLIIRDYSMIELRILAHVAGIKSWKEAFRNNQDLHALNASMMFKVPLDEVTPEIRSKAKIPGFGSAYGLQAQSYMTKVNADSKVKISLDQAKKEMNDFFKAIPEFGRWKREQEYYFRQHNLIRSASGRMRVVDRWHLNDDELYLAKQASSNFPIQASCSDILKTALVKYMRAKSSTSKVVNIVHDEIIVEEVDENVQYESQVLEQCMIEAGEEFIDDVQIKVDGKTSQCWEK